MRGLRGKATTGGATTARTGARMTITEPQFIAALAERGVVVNRSQVNQFRREAVKRGDCQQYGTGRRCTWLWEQAAVDVWARYLRVRPVLVERGLLKRAGYGRVPYRREDVDAVLAGKYADVEQEMEAEQELANDAAEARAPTYNGGCW